eukprot:TRINITY_DN10838_c0_g1_i1.p1 TRINITY_DN10838_c0_g1~~TRINITY_DN10838_c0_g1_i1.p1  ORF type:complete len:568 (-),score=139.31 TRINITY_DN10838_c0_g1_i1:504-2207(-)
MSAVRFSLVSVRTAMRHVAGTLPALIQPRLRVRGVSTRSRPAAPSPMLGKTQQRPGWKAALERHTMHVHFAPYTPNVRGALVVLACEDEVLACSTTAAVDTQLSGAIARAAQGGRFTGKAGQVMQLLAPAGLEAKTVLVVGVGKRSEFNASKAQEAGGAVVAKLLRSGIEEVSVAVDTVPSSSLSLADVAANIAYGARLRSYTFDIYRTTQKPEEKPSLQRLTVMTPESGVKDAQTLFNTQIAPVANSVEFARDVVTEPPNELVPVEFAKRIQQLTPHGITVEVLGEAHMQSLGMGGILGVGQGSEHESQLVVMHYKGAADPAAPPVAFVGKGVTFDTGGISIKPSLNMHEMKTDMGGAAAVVGVMQALAARKAKVNAVGVVGLVENMPDGRAQRPGDIVYTLSGQTIEVLNTDAEGRLVLADALWYTQDRFKPTMMIDLATLTGAILVALGKEHGGLFSNNDELAQRLLAAGEAENERLWRMPLHANYEKAIKSQIADMQNIGGRDAGSVTAAQFLQRFTNKVPWAHLDIAGMVWADEDKSLGPKGATGYGVRLLNRLVADHYEDK